MFAVDSHGDWVSVQVRSGWGPDGLLNSPATSIACMSPFRPGSVVSYHQRDYHGR